MNFVTSHRGWAVFLGIVMMIWSFRPSAERLELAIYSQLSGLLPDISIPADSHIVTVAETADSHAVLARVLERLIAVRPAAIGILFPLQQAQTTLSATTREQLLQAMAASGADTAALGAELDPDTALATLLATDRIILARPQPQPDTADTLPAQALAAPTGLLTTVLRLGYGPPPSAASPTQPISLQFPYLEKASLGWLPASTASVAALPLLLRHDDHYLPGFQLQLLARSREQALDVEALQLQLTQAPLIAGFATDAGYRVYPRLPAELAPLPVLTGEAILGGRFPPAALRDRLILIGTPAQLAATVRVPGGTALSYLEWQAHALNALQANALVNVPHWAHGAQRLALLGVCLYLYLLPGRLRGRLGLLSGGVLVLLIANTGVWLLFNNIWLPLTLPVLYLLAGQLLLWWRHEWRRGHRLLMEQRDSARVELAANLREQGRLDDALAKLGGCAPREGVLEGLYELGLEFERRRQYPRALTVYQRIASVRPRFRDIGERIQRQRAVTNLGTPALPAAPGLAATTLLVDDPKVERPLLGRYSLQRELGRGAMGTVYLGHDPRIGRTVAIKTLPLSEEFESAQLEEVRRRFYQEAETAGRLSHPHIVTIYDVGEDRDLAYIAMDYIPGVNLDEYIRPDNLLPLHEVFTIGIKVAEALDYAHAQKVVHRDVKPANILYDRDSGQIKVTDFGIAHLADHSKTRTGTVLGSPYYMSPEQIAGKRLDGRSDLFSLGVTLYQLFSGYLPFEGENMAALMYQITNQKPRSIRKLRSDLPACVPRILNKALEKDPADRFESGRAMAEALARCASQSGHA